MLEKAVSQQQGDMQNWGIKPSIHINQAHPTVSQELLNRIGNGTIRAKKGSIKHFGEHSVTFDDDYTISNLDEIILCTGYYITIPYLDKGLIDISEDNDLDLYKNVFSPSLPPTISVIGLVQPFGAIMPIAELQARWFCSVLKGEIGLPSVENMMKDIEERRNKLKQRYIHSPRHTVQVDPWDYNEFIARVIGAKPSILKNLALWKELLLIPIFPPQYRLNGPGAKPEIAKKMLKEFYQDMDSVTSGEASTHWMEE